MLVNGAPECIQINQMICLPFVPRTRTNYQATPDVLQATFYFYSHNTQYVQNKTTIHLASTTTYKIYNIHKLHQSAPPQASGRQDPRGCPLRGWPHARHRGISPRTANGRSPNSHHRVPMTSTVPAAGSSGPWSQNHDPLPLRQCLQIKKNDKKCQYPVNTFETGMSISGLMPQVLY